MSRVVDICICTFQRPGLLIEALTSLAALRWPSGVKGRVLVIDNDDTPSAQFVVKDFAECSPVPISYHHAPGRNISIARNAALTISDAPLLAFIDDDERVEPSWIAALISVMEASGADAVLGPVRSLYSPEAPHWMKVAQPHATEPVFVKGTIHTGYTCNVLLDRRSSYISGQSFDLAYGRSGGEDTAFFRAITQAGGCIAYAPDAIVTEDVLDGRASIGWLLRRRYRMGQTHGQLISGQCGFAGRLKHAVLGFAKLTYSVGSALGFAFNAPRRNVAFMRAALHFGVVAGSLGAKPITLYGGSKERAV